MRWIASSRAEIHTFGCLATASRWTRPAMCRQLARGRRTSRPVRRGQLVSAAVEFAAGIPSRWIVTLRSGGVMELAADAYSEEDGQLLFNVLVEADADEQDQVVIDWRTPNNARRVGIVVAKVPAAEVADLYTAPSWFDDASGVDTTT